MSSGARRSLGSTFLWLIALLFVADVALSTTHPLKYISSPKYIPLDQNSVVYKIPLFLSSPERADALVLGSSLPMTGIAYWDDQFVGGVESEDLEQLRKYTGARYLEHLLKQHLGTDLHIFNLTAVACMVSDAHLILKRTIDTGKTPKVVFYGIAPRDFVDNQAQPIGKTPIYQVLSDWRCFGDLMERRLNPTEIRDYLVSSVWYFYKVKADYRTLLTAVTCDLFGSPATLYNAAKQDHQDDAPADHAQATQTVAACPAPLDNELTNSAGKASRLKKSLENYNARYNPPNLTRYKDELSYFRKMLSLCKEHGIRMVVFNMPLTDDNRALLDDSLRHRYENEVLAMPSNYGAVLVDLDKDRSFSLADFDDSVHTNAQGGKKVQDLLVGSLAGKLSM